MAQGDDHKAAMLRRILVRRLNAQDLKNLCFDHFQAVYRKLTDGMSYDEMVLRLVEYCQQRNRLNDLINVLLEAWPDLQDELTLNLPDVAATTPTRMASWRDDNADSDVGNMWSLEEVLAQVRRTLDQYIPRDTQSLNMLLAGLGAALVLLVVITFIAILRNPGPEVTVTPTIPVLRAGVPIQLRIEAGEAATVITDAATPDSLLISVQRCFGLNYNCNMQFSTRLAVRSETVAALDCVLVPPFYVGIVDVQAYSVVTVTVAELSDEFDESGCTIGPTPTALP